MEQTIYGDIFFLINFSMDFLSLYITGAIMHRKIRTAPLALACTIGAAYSVITLLYIGNKTLSIITDIAVSLLMCYIAYKSERIFGYIKTALLFYTVSFSLGGGMTAIYYALNRLSERKMIYINGDIGSLSSDIPTAWLLVCVLISTAVTVLGGFISKRRKRAVSVPLEIEYRGAKTELCGFCDSGNFLFDPIGSRPVIVTFVSEIEGILDKKMADILRSGDIERIPELDMSDISRIRVIPVSSVGHKGLIIGFIPDRVTVCGIERSVCIGVDSGEGSSDAHRAIVPAVLCE